jgi:hypothetical protein
MVFGVTTTLLTSFPVRTSARTTLVICPDGSGAPAAQIRHAESAAASPQLKQKALKMFHLVV